MRRKAGFTLVEILIVVVILAILAAFVLPQFSNANANARATMLMDDLRIMRTQLIVYKAQHADVPAGHPNGDITQAPTESAFVAQITQASNILGATAAIHTPGYPFGPYMREMPENPVNSKRSVRIIPAAQQCPNAPADTDGWIYQPSTLTFKADCSGVDESGKAFFGY